MDFELTSEEYEKIFSETYPMRGFRKLLNELKTSRCSSMEEYLTATTGRKRKFCSDQCRRKYYML